MLTQQEKRIRPGAPDTFYDDMPSVWRASILTIVIIVMLIAAIGIGTLIIGELYGPFRLLASAVISVTPAAAWLFLLYQINAREEIDLSPLVLTIFILGALLAAAVTRPVLSELIEFDTWLSRTTTSNRFWGNILIAGSWNTFLMYAMIRYTVWQTPAFARRVDGLLYGLAAGWGYAAMLNLLFALNSNGLSLLNGNLRLLTQQSAYVSSSIIIGYYLGRTRFEEMPVYYLLFGLTIAAFVNGLTLYASSELNSVGLGFEQDGFSPWPGLVFSILVMAVTFTAIFGLLRRNNTLAKARVERGFE